MNNGLNFQWIVNTRPPIQTLLEQHMEQQDMANITTEEEKIQQLLDFLKEMSTDKTMLTQFVQQKDFFHLKT